uniref:Uncharacterized mitochondrial protein AtMg00810-like n=1 Tax=Tanacetum cinerariifolium TaxID=118510 RepID=A0A6L2KL72_TANCI|nr:uncharacterized mitochondrial protein AtMg00810-like [Tanacetum cinerariifolium]
MTRQRDKLINFVSKFIGTVRFDNHHFMAVMGYTDFKIWNILISWVYYVEGLGFEIKDETPRVIIKFLKQAKVSLQATDRYLRTNNNIEFINKTLRSYMEDVGITHQISVARTPQQNGVVERRNCTLVVAARTMLIFSKSSLFLWAEAVATTCYTQNRSLIHTQYNKTLYERLRNQKPDLKFFHVFGALCYSTNVNEDLGIFINQSKYALKVLKKYRLETSDVIDTPMVERSKLDKDPQETQVDPTLYQSIVGSLMYLIASRSDLVFVVCMCTRYQAKPTEKHLTAVKWVFRYLRGIINMGLWYLKDIGFELMDFADANHIGWQDTRRSTSGSAQFIGEKLVRWSSKKQKCTAVLTAEA